MPAGKKECQPSILRSLEKRVLKRIFRKLLQSGDFAIVLEREKLPQNQNTKLINLRLPNLYRTLQILIKPDRMLGQSYVDGHWGVEPEQLFNFLYLIR